PTTASGRPLMGSPSIASAACCSGLGSGSIPSWRRCGPRRPLTWRPCRHRPSTPKPPTTATMSMANAMATSDGVRERGTSALGPVLGELWRWRTALASAQHPRYNSPPHLSRYGRQSEPRRLRLRSPGAGAARVVPCAPCPGTVCPRGARREALPVRPSPDADDSQLLFLDPTQYRYELIRPLLLCPERTATQRAQETGTHPETVGRLKRRFAQQGMLGLVPETLAVHPAQRQLRVPDTVVHELQRLKGLYAGFGPGKRAGIFFHPTMHRPPGKPARRLWDRLPPAAPPTRPLLDYHSYPERVQARQEVITLYAQGWSKRSISQFLQV